MRRRFIFFLGGLLLFLFGGIIAYSLRVPLPPSGGGRYEDSPDKNWRAVASDLTDGPIIGSDRTYTELMIETPPPSSRTIRRLVIEDMGEPPVYWREEGSIEWATNSSEVTFAAVGLGSNTTMQITLKITP